MDAHWWSRASRRRLYQPQVVQGVPAADHLLVRGPVAPPFPGAVRDQPLPGSYQRYWSCSWSCPLPAGVDEVHPAHWPCTTRVAAVPAEGTSGSGYRVLRLATSDTARRSSVGTSEVASKTRHPEPLVSTLRVGEQLPLDHAVSRPDPPSPPPQETGAINTLQYLFMATRYVDRTASAECTINRSSDHSPRWYALSNLRLVQGLLLGVSTSVALSADEPQGSEVERARGKGEDGPRSEALTLRRPHSSVGSRFGERSHDGPLSVLARVMNLCWNTAELQGLTTLRLRPLLQLMRR